ncbi:MAG: C25 family cysteine peptidase [bacterium]
MKKSGPKTVRAAAGLLLTAAILLATMPINYASAIFQYGDLVRASLPTVYYVGSDGRRYVFPDEKTYFTWYQDFGSVKFVTDTELAALPLGGNVTYRPGMRLIKIQTDPKVYAVDQGGNLRWLANEAVAVTLYGSQWNRLVDDVPDSFFVNYVIGSPINSASDFSPAAAYNATRTINDNRRSQGQTSGQTETTVAPAPAAAPAVTPTPAPAPATVPAPAPEPERLAITAASNYLIVTDDSLYDAALTMKNYRESSGYHVSVATTATAGDTAEEIDAWIDSFRRQHPLRYLVLLGDTNLVPSFRVSITNHEDDGVWSDLNYARYRPYTVTDYLPELMVGRIPAKTPAEVSAYLHKVQAFESNFRSRERMLMFGGGAEMRYAERDAALGFDAGFTVRTLDTTDHDIFVSMLENFDPSVVIYYGHGSWYENEPLDQRVLTSEIDNADRPFVYLSGGCGFWDSTETRSAIGERLVAEENGAAVAIGTSDSGGYGYDYTYTVGFLNLINLYPTIGQLHLMAQRAEIQARPEIPGPADVLRPDYEFTLRQVLFGDPALRIN